VLDGVADDADGFFLAADFAPGNVRDFLQVVIADFLLGEVLQGQFEAGLDANLVALLEVGLVQGDGAADDPAGLAGGVHRGPGGGSR